MQTNKKDTLAIKGFRWLGQMSLQHADRKQALVDYIEAAKSGSFEWGVSDCAQWAALWYESQTGDCLNLQPYGSEEEAREIIKEAGSLYNLWFDVLGREAAEYRTPELGDVGIVDTSRFGQLSVIFLQDGVAVWRSSDGQPRIFRPRNYVAFWSL